MFALFASYFVSLHKVSKVNMATKKRATKRTQIAYENDGSQDGLADSQNADKKSKVFEPESWREIYKLIEQMRSNQVAPVDSMGCEKCHDGQDFDSFFSFRY